MKNILTVFIFTFTEELRKKSTIISIIIITLAILGISLAPSIYQKFNEKDEKDTNSTTQSSDSKDDSEDKKTIYILDEEGVIPAAEEALKATFTEEKIVVASQGDLEKINEEIKESGDAILLTIVPGEEPQINLTRKDFKSSPDFGMISSILSNEWRNKELASKNIDPKDLEILQTELMIIPNDLTPLNPTAYSLSLLISFVLFFNIYGYAISVANSVAMEKSSRVMETLVVSTKPTYILIGKVLAMGTLGFLEIVWFGLVGLFGYKTFVPDDFLIKGLSLDFSSISISSILLLVLIFLLGYLLYVFLAAACGAGVDKIEDVNQAMVPIIFLSLGSFYLAYFSATFMVTEGLFANLSLYFPFASPFYLPFVAMNGLVPTSSIIISLAILLVSFLVVAYISIRIYNASVMNYGTKRKFIELFKMGKHVR